VCETNFHPGSDVDSVCSAVVQGLQSYRRRVDVDRHIHSAAVERSTDAVSVIRSLRIGRGRRITDPIHDHLQPIVAYADRDIAERNAREVEPRGELSVSQCVERETGGEVVVWSVEWQQTADAARQVVVVIVVQATRVVRPHPTCGSCTTPQGSSRLTTGRFHVLTARQFYLYVTPVVDCMVRTSQQTLLPGGLFLLRHLSGKRAF